MSRRMKNDLPPTLAHDRYSRWGCAFGDGGTVA
jgi:hypothetical protein